MQLEKELLKRNKNYLKESKNTKSDFLFSKKTGRGTYSYATELFSNGRKKEGERYTLFDTGSFVKGMYLQLTKDGVVFRSSDSKESLLRLEYESIFGVSQEDLNKIITSRVLPLLQKIFHEILEI